jgi:hypothetical protein
MNQAGKWHKGYAHYHSSFRYPVGERVDPRMLADDLSCPALPKSPGILKTGKYSIENKFWRLRVNPATGWIESLYDKANNFN